jgi:putative flippase GtrA
MPLRRFALAQMCAEVPGYHGQLMRPIPFPLRQFFRFAGVGACATAVHYAVLLALLSVWHWPPLAAVSLGYAAGALSGYVLNYALTFGSSLPHRAAAPRYVLVALGGLALNAALVRLGMAAALPVLAAQAAATVVVLLFNFWSNLAWTFKEPR